MTKTERSWILYDCANSAQTLIVTTAILPIFFKTFAAAGMEGTKSTMFWGLGNSAAALIVAVMAPFLGAMADYRGKKKRFFSGFFGLGIVGTAALAAVGQGDWVLCLLLYGVSTVGFYGSTVFYDSFLVDVTDEERMDWVSASGFAWGYVASTIPYILCMLLITFHEKAGLTTVNATRIAFVITAIWWFVLTIPLLRNVHQQYFLDDTTSPVRDSLVRLTNTLRNIAEYKQLFIFLLAYFMYIDAVQTIYKMATSFGLDVGVSDKQLMVILLVTQLVAFPFALLYGRLAKRFSAKGMILFGIGTYFIVVVLAYFVHTTFHFWVLAMLVGTAQGGIQSLSRSYYGKLVPKEKSAQFFGFYDIFGKFSTILGPILVGGVGYLAGNTRVGVFSLIILFFLGGLLLVLVRDERAPAT